jgi:hypothetical protein
MGSTSPPARPRAKEAVWGFTEGSDSSATLGGAGSTAETAGGLSSCDEDDVNGSVGDEDGAEGSISPEAMFLAAHPVKEATASTMISAQQQIFFIELFSP